MKSTHCSGGARRRRVVPRLVGLSAAVILMIPMAVANASDSGQTSRDVANQIIRLQDKADATAGALAQAELQQQDLAAQIAVAQADVAAKSAEYTALQDQLAQIAVDRYMSGSTGSVDILFGSPIDELQTQALSAAVYDAGAVSLDQVETAKSELESEQANLEVLLAQNDQLTATMATKQTKITEQLAELEALKATLVDAEAKQAYAEALAERRAKDAQEQAAAEQAANRAAAAQAAASNNQSGSSSGSGPVSGAANGSGSASNGSTAATPSATPVLGPDGKPVDSPLLPSAPAPATDDSVDNPDGSPGSAEPAKDPVVIVDTSFVCPLAGSTAFGDTWGDARSGGRHHEGVDMMAAFGTPEVAVVAGFATFKTNVLGGNVISLAGSDGNRYYYAHLSSWEGGSRAVNQGEVIGYVGHTGDTSANHLHFEIHPGGGAAVNPYPTVRKYC